MSTTLNDQVHQKVKPMYEILSSDELLHRCIRLGTHNANECLHGVVWRKCPKELFMSVRRYPLGATRAIGEFNMGLTAMAQLRSAIRGETVSSSAVKITAGRDNKRKRKRDEQPMDNIKQR